MELKSRIGFEFISDENIVGGKGFRREKKFLYRFRGMNSIFLIMIAVKWEDGYTFLGFGLQAFWKFRTWAIKGYSEIKTLRRRLGRMYMLGSWRCFDLAWQNDLNIFGWGISIVIRKWVGHTNSKSVSRDRNLRIFLSLPERYFLDSSRKSRLDRS